MEIYKAKADHGDKLMTGMDGQAYQRRSGQGVYDGQGSEVGQ